MVSTAAFQDHLQVMARFVILEHDFPQRHWDLMLEASGVLRTWRLARCPRAGSEVPAQPSVDHRAEYLDYEGPVSGGRGTVVRWDHGEFTWQEQSPDRLEIRLEGRRQRGTAVLSRDFNQEWLLTIYSDARTDA
jgi:hypothetical protein